MEHFYECQVGFFVEYVQCGEVFLVEASVSRQKAFRVSLGIGTDQEVGQNSTPLSAGFGMFLPLCSSSIGRFEIQKDDPDTEGLQSFIKEAFRK